MNKYTRTTEEADELLTVPEVARILRWDGTTIRRHIKDGSLEAITLPHRGTRRAYRVRRSTLDTILAGNSEEVKRNAGRAS